MARSLFSVSAGLFAAGALFSPLALASPEEVQDLFSRGTVYLFLFLAACFSVAVVFMKMRDKRGASLESSVISGRQSVHTARSDAMVIDCVRQMAAEKIGALVIMECGKLAGIFTERDALNKVLAEGRDPTKTWVSDVMTRDPYCVTPQTTIGEAMEVVTARRFRHLPVVEDGNVLAVVSSGDLTHWLVKDQIREVKQIVDLAARRQLS